VSRGTPFIFVKSSVYPLAAAHKNRKSASAALTSCQGLTPSEDPGDGPPMLVS
jgi:hypothetical protein